MPIAIRDKIAANVQSHLAPGEQIQAAFPAQTFSGWWAMLSWIIVVVKSSYRAIVVTDRRILVFDTGKLTMGTPKRLLRELPRATRIGPASGLWYRTEALGERIYVHKRFHKDIETADGLG